MGLASSFISISISRAISVVFAADRRAGFGFHLAVALGFALVVQFFALGDGQLQLDAAVFQVHLGGDERQPFFAGLAQQLVDFGRCSNSLRRRVGSWFSRFPCEYWLI